MARRKICVVTSSRADYGLLYWLMKDIDADPEYELQVAVAGMHLAPEFGGTYRVIEADGFTINAEVEMALSSDTAEGVTKSLAKGVSGFADVFASLQPDMVVLLGDRYEAFAAAQAALLARIPVAHIAGGDTTEGAYDEAFRHAITKMAHLHFVTNEVSANRVRQLGENPQYIFNTGSPGIDYIRRLKLLSRDDLERELDFKFRKRNFVITFHPATLEMAAPADQFNELLKAVKRFEPRETGLIFTKPNADTGSRALVSMIDEFVAGNENARAYTSLGQRLYLSLLARVDVVVGNSSSGLYEAPSFGKPTVNIGDRQKGRLQASSVISCKPIAGEIAVAIEEALRRNCSNTTNPYGDGDSSRRILAELKRVRDPQTLVKKTFFDLH